MARGDRTQRLVQWLRTRRDRGVTVVEYALLIAVVGIVSLGSITWFEERSQDVMEAAINCASADCGGAPVAGGGGAPSSPSSSTSTTAAPAPTSSTSTSSTSSTSTSTTSTSSTSTTSTSTTSIPSTTSTTSPSTTSTTVPPGGQVDVTTGARRQDWRNWEALATASLVDEQGRPLRGAVVTFEFTEQPSGRTRTLTCTTSGSGTCTVSQGGLDRRGSGEVTSVDVRVVDVQGGSGPWNGVAPDPSTIRQV